MNKKILGVQNPIFLAKNTKFFQELIFFFRKIGPSGDGLPAPLGTPWRMNQFVRIFTQCYHKWGPKK